MKLIKTCMFIALAAAPLLSSPAHADEQVLGYIKGAEPMPKGGTDFDTIVTHRWDKGAGSYHATDYTFELERGLTSRLTGALKLKAMTLDTHGLRVDAYIPKDKKFDFKPSGVEAELKYAFLTPALDDIGLMGYFALVYDWIDKYSGQDKDTYSMEAKLLTQKYFMDGQLVWAGNVGLETTYAHRAPVSGLPEDFDWPTDPEMEIEFLIGTGLSYRFAPNWSIGAEVFYETEFETEVGTERWSVHAGPSLHYGAHDWWATLTWLPQLRGGGEKFDEQDDRHLHLIEKTKQEVRLKVGFNF